MCARVFNTSSTCKIKCFFLRTVRFGSVLFSISALKVVHATRIRCITFAHRLSLAPIIRDTFCSSAWRKVQQQIYLQQRQPGAFSWNIMLFIIVGSIIIICATLLCEWILWKSLSSASGDQRKSYEITTKFHLIIIILPPLCCFTLCFCPMQQFISYPSISISFYLFIAYSFTNYSTEFQTIYPLTQINYLQSDINLSSFKQKTILIIIFIINAVSSQTVKLCVYYAFLCGIEKLFNFKRCRN